MVTAKTSRKPRGRSTGKRVTRDEWAQVVSRARDGISANAIAKQLGVDPRTVGKMLNEGITYGAPWGGDRPIKVILEEEQVEARIARQEMREAGGSPELKAAMEDAVVAGVKMNTINAAAAKAVAQMNPGVSIPHQAVPLDKGIEKARDDALQVRKQEAALLEVNRVNALTISASLSTLNAAMKTLMNRLQSDLLNGAEGTGKDKVRFTTDQVINYTYKIFAINERAASITRTLIDTETLRMGNSEKASTLNPGTQTENIPPDQAVKELSRTMDLFARMQSRGMHVIRGGEAVGGNAPNAPEADMPPLKSRDLEESATPAADTGE